MRAILAALCVVATLSCQGQQNQQDELPDVERVVYDLFESIASFNYPSIRDHCTDDFILFEDGQTMNVQEFIDSVKGFDGKGSIDYSLEEVKTNIDGSFAWMTLRNKAVMIMNGQTASLEWIESAVLRKEEGLWKIAFYHSTRVKDSEGGKSSH